MDILFQDPSILVINKPAGIPVLPDGWEKDTPYLLKLLEEEFGKLWVVHRLDKVTSGVMLFARTAAAHRILNIQFEHRDTLKEYHAIINGLPPWRDHIARHPLRINVGHSHRTAIDNAKGKASETHFHVLKRYAGYCLMEVQPATGRTHQIRVHAYALGYPLLGDTLYSAPPTDLIARPALHARLLRISHPLAGESLSFSAPYPADFKKALEAVKAEADSGIRIVEVKDGN